MKIKGLIVILLLFVSLVHGYKYEEKVEKSFTLTTGALFQLSNINGIVEAETYKGDTVLIKAIKMTDKEGDLEKVEILFDYQKDRLKVKVHKDKKWRRLSFKVEFYLKIPARLRHVSLVSVNGKVKTRGDFKQLNLKTTNGRIEFKWKFAEGSFRSINGRIEVFQQEALKGDTSLKTINGSLRLHLNKDSNFRVDGTTVNGSIRSDFDVTIKRRFVGSKMRGTNNGGKHRLYLKSVNGSIRLMKI